MSEHERNDLISGTWELCGFSEEIRTLLHEIQSWQGSRHVEILNMVAIAARQAGAEQIVERLAEDHERALKAMIEKALRI